MQARLSDQHNADASVQAAIKRAATMNREATLKFEDLRNAISHAGATNKKSSLYRDMRRMLSYEIHIKFAYSALLSLGLSTFTPDIYGNNPDSFYNLLHERIALSTFEHMCTSFAYTAFNVNLQYTQDPTLLQKVQSFVNVYRSIYKSNTPNRYTATFFSLISARMAKRKMNSRVC